MKRQNPKDIFDQFFNNSIDLLCIADIKGYFLKLNPEWERSLGYALSELEGKLFIEFVHPDDVADTIQVTRELAGKRKVQNFVNRYRHKDGSYRWIEWRSFPSEGLIYASARDITDRKTAEMELVASEEKYVKAFLNTPDAVSISNCSSLQFIYVNEIFIRNIGYQNNEVIGKTATELNLWRSPEDRDALMKLLDHQKTLKDYEIKFRIRSGEIRDYLVNAEIVVINHKYCYLFYARDISERNKVEESLRQSEKKYRLLFENMTSGFALHQMIYDEKGQPADYRYIEANPAFEKLTGLSSKDIIGKTIKEIVPTIEDHWIQTFGHVALTGEPIHYLNYAKDLGKFYETYVFSPEKDKYAVVFNDATERINAENALRASEQKLAVFYNLTLDMVGITRLSDDKIMNANPATTLLTGYAPDEYLNKSIQELKIWANPSERVRILKDLKDKGEIKNQEIEIRNKNGSFIPCLFSAKTLTYDNELCFLFVINDITERKHIEEQIKRNEGRLKRAQIVGHIGYSEQNVHENKVWASAEGMNIFGFPPVEGYLTLENIKDRVVDFAPFRKAYLELIEQGKRFDLEYAINPADGSPQKYIHAVAEIEKDEDGKPLKFLTIFQDITQRKVFENALRISEEKLRGITQNIPGVVFQYFVTRDGKSGFNYISDLSMKSADIDNNDRASFMERFVARVVDEDRPGLMSSIQKAVESASRWEWEGRYIRPDGKEMYFRGIAQPKELNGELTFNGIVFDITEQKKAENKFKQLAMLHQTVLDTVNVGLMYVIDRKTQWVNSAFCQMFGYDHAEAFELDTIVLYARKDDYIRIGDEAYRIFLSGSVFSLELPAKKKDGSTFWINLSGKAVDAEKPNEGSIWMLQDVTEQKNAELALRKSESVLKATMESIGDGLLVVSADNEATHFNTSFRKLFSIPNDILYTFDDKVLLNYASQKISKPDVFIRRVQEINLTKTPSEDILHFTDGRIIERLSFHLSEDSPMRGRVWLFRDITDRKQAEEEIIMLNQKLERRVEERTAKLNQVNKDLESFAYSVSHDLRAPIRHIDGFVKLMFSKIEQPGKPIIDYYNKIEAATQRMSTMIDSLLSFSRLGRKELTISLIDLDFIVHDIINQYKPDIGTRRIVWNINRLPGIQGDKNLIKLVFENLISNAIKYTSKKQKAIIEIGCITKPDSHYELYVRDNGTGFDMVYANKLFHVFQRLHTSDEYEGIGIGLANVRQIVEKHKGTVRAEGQVDEGAVFYITLPII